MFLKTYIIFLKVEKEFLNLFSNKIEGTGFSDKVSSHSNLKILLTPTQMLQRLPITLAQVKIRLIRNQTNHIFFVSSKRNH